MKGGWDKEEKRRKTKWEEKAEDERGGRGEDE